MEKVEQTHSHLKFVCRGFDPRDERNNQSGSHQNYREIDRMVAAIHTGRDCFLGARMQSLDGWNDQTKGSQFSMSWCHVKVVFDLSWILDRYGILDLLRYPFQDILLLPAGSIGTSGFFRYCLHTRSTKLS